jgi:transcriptional regulator with PAS, ATPase and Fis domain
MAAIVKTSEKLIIWMHRSRYNQQDVAKELRISRQALARKIRDNFWTGWEIQELKRLGIE